MFNHFQRIQLFGVLGRRWRRQADLSFRREQRGCEVELGRGAPRTASYVHSFLFKVNY